MDALELLTQGLLAVAAVGLAGAGISTAVRVTSAPAAWRVSLACAASLAALCRLAFVVAAASDLDSRSFFDVGSYVLLAAEIGIVATVFALPTRAEAT
ncbi:MAG: hypothetical protein RIT81_18785 [Deltaproteobacteria bacterium]